MKNKILTVMVALFLVINLFPVSVFAAELNDDDIIILYENDVHCEVTGYSKLSAMKKELQKNMHMLVWFPAVITFKEAAWVLYPKVSIS